MIIEDRLAQAAEDARRVADSFEAPGIQRGMGLRWRRRIVAAATIGAVVIVIAVAAVWGMADLISNETPPADTGPGPELQWTTVPNPPEVLHVYNVWATDDGFALTTGSEVWTSRDGQTWGDTATTPSALYLNDGRSLVNLDGTWIGTDATADVPTVLTNVSGAWVPITLPLSYEPDNDLLTATVRFSLIAGTSDSVVVAGTVQLWPDPDAVMARFAPEAAESGDTARLNLARQTVDIADSAGTVVARVAFCEIDTRFADFLGPMGTVIWHSENGTDWEQVATSDQEPLFLGGDNSGFALVTTDRLAASELWTSTDGVRWDSTTVSPPQPAAYDYALYDGQVIAAGPAGLVAIDRHGDTETISIGDAFSDLDPNLTFGDVITGPYGIIATAYDSSTGSVPVRAIWYSPDGIRWSRQNLADVFGSKGAILVAVGKDKVLLGHDPRQSTFLELRQGYELWIGRVP